MSGELITTRKQEIGRAANNLAQQFVFQEYRDEKSTNTLKRQLAGLTLFADCLAQIMFYNAPASLDSDEYTQWLKEQASYLATKAEAWRGITHGLVKHFFKWLLDSGYSVTTANVRLSTVRVYADLAYQAGIISEGENRLIQTVKGKSRKAAKNINEKRQEAEIPTRLGSKKQSPVVITQKQAKALKSQPCDTGQGRRDRLIMSLLVDFGMRVSELAALTVDNFDFDGNVIEFYCPKTDDWRRLDLSPDVKQAARDYIEQDVLMGALFRTSRKDGRLHKSGMSIRNLANRVRVLGEKIGIEGLSPHDLRHYAATREAPLRTTRGLMDYFGWKSSAMAVRYQNSLDTQDWRATS